MLISTQVVKPKVQIVEKNQNMFCAYDIKICDMLIYIRASELAMYSCKSMWAIRL